MIGKTNRTTDHLHNLEIAIFDVCIVLEKFDSSDDDGVSS